MKRPECTKMHRQHEDAPFETPRMFAQVDRSAASTLDTGASPCLTDLCIMSDRLLIEHRTDSEVAIARASNESDGRPVARVMA